MGTTPGGIRARQPKRAAGFMAWKEFSHKAKHRMNSGKGEQGTRVGAMKQLQFITTQVDTARYNWPGLVGVQASSGMYDPRPRLVKKVEQAVKDHNW